MKCEREPVCLVVYNEPHEVVYLCYAHLLRTLEDYPGNISCITFLLRRDSQELVCQGDNYEW